MLRAMHKQCATHMPDALHVRTNELTNAELPTLREKSELSNAHGRVWERGFIYFVNWPAEQFTKVGCSMDGKRWRPFLRRGGVLLGAMETTGRGASLMEWRMHVELNTVGVPHRFTSSAEARPYLGGIGRGFTECYIDLTGRDVFHHLIAWASRRQGA